MSAAAMALTTEDRELLEGFAVHVKELNANWKTAQEQIAKTGTVTVELAEKLRTGEAKADEMGRQVEALGKELAAKLQKSDERLDKVESDMRVVKQKSWRPQGMTELPQAGRALSFGERFVQHEGFKNVAQWSGKFKHQIHVAGRVLHPYMERKAVTITEAGSGYPIVPTRVGVIPNVPMQNLVMRDLLTVVPLVGTNAVEYVIETWNYAADYQVAEGDKKAQGDVTYTDASVMVRTIAWFVKISRQMLADVPYIAATIDTRLIYGVQLKEERELLYGDNAAGHLWGIMPQAVAIPADVLGAGVVTTRIDELAAAVAYQTNAGYPPTAIVLNAMTWAQMQLSKNQMGGYILGGPPVADATPRLWGLPVVSTPQLNANDYLVGMFPGNAILFDRESVTVDVAYENEDDFVRNLVTFRAEERIALAVIVPAAFGKGPFRAPAVEPPAGTTLSASRSEKK